MRIFYTAAFKSEAEKFLKKAPQYRKKLKKTISLLANDPYYPSLRLHKVGEDQFSISVDMKIRIIIIFDRDKIFLCHIGNHDQVYN